MDVETEAWRLHLNPKTWLSGKNARGDGNLIDKKQEKVSSKSRGISGLSSTIPLPPPEVDLKGPKVKEATREPKPKVTLCFHNRKKKFSCPVPCKEREASLGSLTASCNDNCSRCCAIICKYLQDVFNCVYCLVNCRWPCTNFWQLARQLAAAAVGACSDCIYIVRYILRCLVGEKK